MRSPIGRQAGQVWRGGLALHVGVGGDDDLLYLPVLSAPAAPGCGAPDDSSGREHAVEHAVTLNSRPSPGPSDRRCPPPRRGFALAASVQKPQRLSSVRKSNGAGRTCLHLQRGDQIPRRRRGAEDVSRWAVFSPIPGSGGWPPGGSADRCQLVPRPRCGDRCDGRSSAATRRLVPAPLDVPTGTPPLLALVPSRFGLAISLCSPHSAEAPSDSGNLQPAGIFPAPLAQLAGLGQGGIHCRGDQVLQHRHVARRHHLRRDVNAPHLPAPVATTFTRPSPA